MLDGSERIDNIVNHSMTVTLLLFALICAIFIALMEIQIEGKHGWAAKLPTWKIYNPWTEIFSIPYITGYHTYLLLSVGSLLHSPFFFGVEFNLHNELVVIQVILILMLFEDFLWFVLNPAWGIKKFMHDDIPWHSGKFLYIPKNYWVVFITVFVLNISS